MPGSDNVTALQRDHLTYLDSVVGKGKGAVAGPVAEEEDSCPAFGFLRGLEVRALALEFRFLSGDSEWFSYSRLESWRFNRSVGLLLKFTSDVTTLVLVQGSNLDAQVSEAQVNLTDRGLQRHRILYVREMAPDEIKRTQKGQPTIDRIVMAEFETVEEQQDWLKRIAPEFVRK